jgi:hypothetical protein
MPDELYAVSIYRGETEPSCLSHSPAASSKRCAREPTRTAPNTSAEEATSNTKGLSETSSLVQNRVVRQRYNKKTSRLTMASKEGGRQRGLQDDMKELCLPGERLREA